MKILFFIEGLYSGGKERRLVELIKKLSKRPDVKMELVLTKEGIHYKDIFSSNIKIHYTLRKKLKRDPKVFYEFYKIAKKFRPDIIHVWGNLVAIYAIPAKVLLRIPMINSQIADSPDKVSRSILGPRLSFPYSDRIISNSYAGLKAYNAPENKSRVIYNGFNFDRIGEIDKAGDLRKKFGIKTEFVIGMVASFSDKKDYTTYIKAANQVINNISDVSFLCIGSGDHSEFEKLVEKENLEKVFFLGRQKEVESIMNICDLGVLTTYTEGISNALLEFMSLKKPVLVTGGGGCGELVEHNKSGYIFERGANIKLADKIIELLRNKERREELGERSFEIVRDKFSIESMARNFYQEYKENVKFKN